MTAPTTAQYLVLANDGTLSAERKLVFGEGFAVNDGGGNSDYSVSVVSRVLIRQSGGPIQSSGTLTTTIISTILGANLLSTNGALQLLLGGQIISVAASNASLSIAVILGATTMYKDSIPLSSAAPGSRAYFMKLMLSAENATNAQVLTGSCYVSDTAAPVATTGLGHMASVEQTTTTPILGSATENSAVSLTLVVWMRMQGAIIASISAQNRLGILRKL